jgi:hypothetical protein
MRMLKPERDIVLVQSADPVNYFSMLRSTARINREFCLRQDVEYTCHHGIMRGFHAWQACYNRVFLLNNLIDLGFTGWYIHLDADAWVHDVNFDIRGYLAGCAAHSFVFAHGATQRPWDVNDGIFLAHCAHPETVEVARAWKKEIEALSEDRLRKAATWYENGLPGDQQLLHTVLRRDESRLAAQIRHEPVSFMNAPTSSVFRQVLRSQQRDPVLRLDDIQLRVGTALAAQNLPAEDPVTTFCSLARGLGLPLPRDAAEIREVMASPQSLAAFLRPVVEKTAPASPPAAAPAP